MDNCRQRGKEIKTEVVGVAYSMAGIIALYGDKGSRSIVNYGTIMIHDPKFAFGEPEKESAKMMLSKVTDSLTMLIENNSGLTNDQTREYMGKETTFSATESLQNGFVDQITQTGRQVQPMSNHYELMVACSDIFNNKNVKPKEKKMSILTDYLGLNPEANETAILGAVKDLKKGVSNIQALTDEKTVLENKVKLLSDENNTLKENAMTEKATALVNKAIEEGRIQKEGSAAWIENAKKDFEGTKSLLAGLSVVPADINDSLESEEKQAPANGLAEEYEKILNESPELLDSMPDAKREAMEKAFDAKFNAVKSQVIK
jgi:hypothetical protein